MKDITGWMIYREKDIPRNQRFIQFMEDAAQKRGMDVSLVLYEDIQIHVSNHHPRFFYDESGLSPTFIINRSVSPWLNEVAELSGIRCFNSAYVARIGNDKRLTHATMANIGIPMLQSKAMNRKLITDTSQITRLPFIVKDPLGRGGTGVELIETQQTLEQFNSSLPEDVLHQPVGGKKGKDLRIYIIGNQIQGAVLRESTTNFRANISTGGNSSYYEVSEKEQRIVKEITNAFHMDFVGLDFLIDEDGSLLFNEMEDVVGCRSLYMNSSIDIADRFVEYVYQQLAKE